MNQLKLLLLWALALLHLLSMTCAYVQTPCLSTDKKDMGCTCAQTEIGVSCPENYYCPEYSTFDVAFYNSSVLFPARCTVDMTKDPPYVQCPCPPGFYCPVNTSQAVYCCPGFYCPSDSTAPPISGSNPNGLGTWGAKAFECPEGKYCQTAQVEPFPCPPLGRCSAGATEANKAAQWAILIVVIILICIMFAAIEFYRDRQKKIQVLMFDKTTELNQALLNEPQTVHSTSPYSRMKSFLVEFENIGLTLKNGTTIMRGVNGKFQPGRMCAVMGPSGAGKTTIISLVTGKALKTTGKVKVNGQEEDGLTKYQKLIGFVPQDDVMIRTLSVRDNISFSAGYRLPADLSEEEVTKRVNETIDVLGISHVQHSIIGDERTRGISGGQRKRVNIGIELVTDPSVLFLDEPTSGLDSTTATALCQTLKKIARDRQMTVVSVIHQPSLTSFLEFDDLLLLGKGGQVVYFGPVNEAPKYFENIGFSMPAHCNPADYYLDLCQGAIPRKGHPAFQWPELFDIWEGHRTGKGSNLTSHASLSLSVNDAKAVSDDTSMLEHAWEMASHLVSSTYYYCEDYIINFFVDLSDMLMNCCKPDPIRVTPGFLKQLRLCVRRSLKQVFTTPYAFVMELMLHLGVGILISVAAENIAYIGPYPDPICSLTPVPFRPDCFLPSSDNYKQIANFMCFGVLFASIAAASATFGNEQVNYWRECAAGLQSIPYFIAKFIANFPRVVGAALFFFIAFDIRFQNTASSNELYLIIFGLYWFGFSIGYVVSQTVSPLYSAMVGVLVALIFSLGLAGVNPSLKEVNDYEPPGRQIPWYVSGPRWTLEAFYVSQVKYYYKLPAGAEFSGAPYLNIQSGLENSGYNINAFPRDIRAIFLCGFGWSMFALYLMLVSYRDKKR